MSQREGLCNAAFPFRKPSLDRAPPWDAAVKVYNARGIAEAAFPRIYVPVSKRAQISANDLLEV